ncbi:hypothetical protein BH10ACI1_BH10ACI1_17460 [soil metagenome]
MQTKKTKKEPTFTVSYRLNASYLAKLEVLAERHNISVHEQARILLLDALDNRSEEEIKTDIKRTREEVKDLKLSVAVAFEALLVKAGNVEKETAKEWITEQFR